MMVGVLGENYARHEVLFVEQDLVRATVHVREVTLTAKRQFTFCTIRKKCQVYIRAGGRNCPLGRGAPGKRCPAAQTTGLCFPSWPVTFLYAD